MDPGNGMGSAALRAVREFRFATGNVGAATVATKIPFVITFVSHDLHRTFAVDPSQSDERSAPSSRC
jgi:hypothetical protein